MVQKRFIGVRVVKEGFIGFRVRGLSTCKLITTTARHVESPHNPIYRVLGFWCCDAGLRVTARKLEHRHRMTFAFPSS